MRLAAITLLILSMFAQAAWIPPTDANPSAIFQEAQQDAGEGRFEDALAKHLWFHEHALKIEPAQYGVRLSFALAAWRELAAKYPPAMAALRNARDAAESNVKSTGDFHSFHDAVALNETLRESARTVAFFKWVSENQPASAKRAFGVAQPALVAAKEYALCGKYLEPEADYHVLVTAFRQNLKMSKQERFAGMKDFGEKKFASDVGTLVFLLVQNDRKEEAKAVRDKAAKEWESEKFHRQLDESLQGEPPPSFPPHDV